MNGAPLPDALEEAITDYHNAVSDFMCNNITPNRTDEWRDAMASDEGPELHALRAAIRRYAAKAVKGATAESFGCLLCDSPRVAADEDGCCSTCGSYCFVLIGKQGRRELMFGELKDLVEGEVDEAVADERDAIACEIIGDLRTAQPWQADLAQAIRARSVAPTTPATVIAKIASAYTSGLLGLATRWRYLIEACDVCAKYNKAHCERCRTYQDAALELIDTLENTPTAIPRPASGEVT